MSSREIRTKRSLRVTRPDPMAHPRTHRAARRHQLLALLFAIFSATTATSLSRLAPLRGGASDITVRVRTRSGTVRTTLPSSATLEELQRKLKQDHKLPVAKQRLSKSPKGEQPLDAEADGAKSLEELGIAHGAMLHLELPAEPTAAAKSSSDDAGEAAPASSDAPAPTSPAPPPRAQQGRRTRSTTMADYVDAKSANEVVLEPPTASKCDYVAVEPAAAKAFSDFLLERDFGERRVALLYGRWVDPPPASGEKRGVLVDVIYEPAQLCDAASLAVDESADASAERKRADALAASLGLRLVGVAFAHPPRHHTLEPAELALVAALQQQAIDDAADDKSAAAAAAELFVGVLFRAVHEGEGLDGDATAEVYQPTPQARELLARGALAPAADAARRLVPSEPLDFKVGPKVEPTVDLSYFVTRIRDLAKPYAAPACGALRGAFPVANRGAPLRKFHLRTFLQRQREAEVPFDACARDFQLLLHAAGVLPEPTLAKLCGALAVEGTPSRAVREANAAAISAAERALADYAGLGKAAA